MVKVLYVPCRQLSVDDIVSVAVEGRSRSSRDAQGTGRNSTVDSIVHFRTQGRVPRGGLLSSSPPDWLSRFSKAARMWLQHWLKPRHLKGEHPYRKCRAYKPLPGLQ